MRCVWGFLLDEGNEKELTPNGFPIRVAAQCRVGKQYFLMHSDGSLSNS
jgi:hypothetical protein